MRNTAVFSTLLVVGSCCAATLCAGPLRARADDITTNAVTMVGAPKWLKPLRVERVVEQIQRFLEWDIRRITVRWYNSPEEFHAAHGFDSSVLAVSKRADDTMHIGPKVTTENFDSVFGHELAHIIMFQKYKDAIPKWLEEGLANYAAKRGTIDYKYLASHPAMDVRALTHPFSAVGGGTVSPPNPKFHYMASTALMEMIASHCQVHDLLQLSVGEKLESYLDTFCGIPDVNAEFRKWVARKAR